jgi:hypothetical protein
MGYYVPNVDAQRSLSMMTEHANVRAAASWVA